MTKLFYNVLSVLFVTLFATQLKSQNTTQQQNVLQEAGVTEQDVSTALKQTLTLSADQSAQDLSSKKAVKSNSLFGANFPSTVKNVFQTLIKNGQADLVKKLEADLNSKVPNLVNNAKSVIDLYTNNTEFRNAYSILMGEKNAATQYLKTQSGADIEKAVKPLIENLLNSSGTLDKWNTILEQYNQITGKNVSFDLSAFVSKSLVNNMFQKMSEEETKIRLNQLFWGSLIMKKVLSLQLKVPR